MQKDKLQRSIQREINDRRERGGALPVPPWMWDTPQVTAALAKAVKQAQTERFDGDWDDAPSVLEDRVSDVTAALLGVSQVSERQSKEEQARPGHLPINRRLGQEAQRNRLTSNATADVVRYDAGSRTLTEYLNWRLRGDGTADFYRRTICGGEYVTREEAWEFLTASLPKVLSSEDYEQIGLCPVKARGRLLSKYLQRTANLTFFYTNMLMIDPKTGYCTATTDTLYDKHEHYCAEVSLPAVDGAGKRLKRLILHRNHNGYSYIAQDDLLPKPYYVPGVLEDVHVPPAPAPFFPDGGRFVEGYAQSVMGELIGGAHLLCEIYPVSMWDMLEALLTGALPPQPAIEALCQETRIERVEDPEVYPSDYRGSYPFTVQGPVTLTVQPWVTPEDLADAWREVRRNNKRYSPSEMQAETFQFVLSHTPPNEPFEWAILADQWEQERGERMTRAELYKRFQRAMAATFPPLPPDGF